MISSRLFLKLKYSTREVTKITKLTHSIPTRNFFIKKLSNFNKYKSSFLLFTSTLALLPTHKSEVIKYNDELSAPLLCGSKKEIIDSLREFVNQGGNINKKWGASVNSEGSSLLQYVIDAGRFRYGKDAGVSYYIIKELFELGAIVDTSEFQEGSPLHDIFYFNGDEAHKLGVVKALLEVGYDVNKKNKWDQTPLDCAIDNNKCSDQADLTEIIDLMLRYEALPGVQKKCSIDRDNCGAVRFFWNSLPVCISPKEKRACQSSNYEI